VISRGARQEEETFGDGCRPGHNNAVVSRDPHHENGREFVPAYRLVVFRRGPVTGLMSEKKRHQFLETLARSWTLRGVPRVGDRTVDWRDLEDGVTVHPKDVGVKFVPPPGPLAVRGILLRLRSEDKRVESADLASRRHGPPRSGDAQASAVTRLEADLGRLRERWSSSRSAGRCGSLAQRAGRAGLDGDDLPARLPPNTGMVDDALNPAKTTTSFWPDFQPWPTGISG
jgi:hypothetical protein